MRVSGLCAGVAGLIATSNIKAADSSRVGEMMELDAIFAVVVGGTPLTGGRFTLVGSVIGALLHSDFDHDHVQPRRAAGGGDGAQGGGDCGGVLDAIGKIPRMARLALVGRRAAA